MASRKNLEWDPKTRLKIKTTLIINRLNCFVLDENWTDGKPVKMSSTQVNAALGLLRKTLPDLTSVEVDMFTNGQSNNVVSADPMSAEQWQNEYEDHLAAPAGTTKSSH